MSWKIEEFGKKPVLNKPILIEGLPGIGNVGKVAADFIIEEMKAKKLYGLFSYTFPHSVFVNEKNLIELPKIEVYYKKMDEGNDLLFLAGDIQPIDEVSCYEFCDKVLDMLQEFGGKEVVTLGGIGLQHIPKKPRVFCTGNGKDAISKYSKGINLRQDLHGVVGPIIGVSGVLLGLAEKRKIPAVSLLAETYGHPMYLGVKGAREIVKILNKKMSLGIDVKKLDKEIEKIEGEVMKKTEEMGSISKKSVLSKVGKFGEETRYIG